MHAAANAIMEKKHNSFNMIFTMLFKSELRDYDSRDEEKQLFYTFSEYVEKLLDEIALINCRNSNSNHSHPMEVILKLIDSSLSDEKLAKCSISWNPWF